FCGVGHLGGASSDADAPSRSTHDPSQGEERECSKPTSPCLGGAMLFRTARAGPRKSRKPAPEVSETNDDHRQAMDWFAKERRWERTLDALRAKSARR